MLRGALLGLGCAAIIAGVLLIAVGFAFPAGVEVLGAGVILAIVLLFERRGYRPKVDRLAGRWEQTSERFIDPVSGHVIEVRYNPDTGERDYVDTGVTK
jgi:hypothetical protein